MKKKKLYEQFKVECNNKGINNEALIERVFNELHDKIIEYHTNLFLYGTSDIEPTGFIKSEDC